MKAGRVMTLVGAGVTFVIVFIVILWVIPRVASDTSPMASPEDAVHACSTFVIANMFFGLAIVGTTFLIRSGASTMLLVIIGVSILLFCLRLLVSAFDLTNHGPSMQDVAAVLFACAGGEGLAGLLTFVGAALLARARKRELRDA